MSVRGRLLVATVALAFPAGLTGATLAARAQTPSLAVEGLRAEAKVIRDRSGVPHVYAHSDHDAYFLMGWLHASDRFFQMDFSRRQASGTLAELMGPSVLAGDVQLRTIGLRRAAARSQSAYSPESLAVLQAYADGVNAWIAANPLPPEYGPLELTSVPPWEVLDSLAVAKLLAFGLSFDSGDLTNTSLLAAYRSAGAARGFDGNKLFFDDLMRSAPFDPAISILPGEASGPLLEPKGDDEDEDDETNEDEDDGADEISQAVAQAARTYLRATADIPVLNGTTADRGSNWWVISGSKSESKRPLLANDPHLSLTSPPVFHEIHLVVARSPGQDPLNVYGVGFPGAPGVIQGFNEQIAWGSTVNPLDVTDFYQERVIADGAGRPVATLFRGAVEPLTIIPETFSTNQPGNGTPMDVVPVPPTSGVPPATFVVPRRNNGPLITAPAGSPLRALSVQYSGFSPTRELETFLVFSRASSVADFKRGLQFFDVGSQNWSYMDRNGNIAYFTSAELPLREDLQAGFVDGPPPSMVRDGTGTLRHEWIRNDNPPTDQALRFEILPFDEMPQIVNPKKGWIANANNDPIGLSLDNNPLNQLRRGGQGILYLSPGYAIGNRMARIDRLIREQLDDEGELSLEDMARIQADTVLLDAEVLTPYILAAFRSAATPGAPPELAAFASDPAVRESIGRLASWHFTTRTDSVAATIYSLWRGQVLRNSIDATLGRIGLGGFLPTGDRSMIALRNLLDHGGTSASGLDFFDAQGVTLAPAAEREIVLLQSLKDALSLAASPAFAPAFGGSTDQRDYRWGKLHRIVFRHPLGSTWNIPPGAGFADTGPGLPGIATDGGFDVVDASSHNPRASSLNGFMFASGPARRFLGEAGRNRVDAVEVIPGGETGTPGTAFFGSQLDLWLANDYHDALTKDSDVRRRGSPEEEFRPIG